MDNNQSFNGGGAAPANQPQPPAGYPPIAAPTNPAPAGAKSATVAGLLGIFLGGVGAHNWYLGQKTKGIIHCALVGGGILLLVVIDLILPSTMSILTLYTMAGFIALLNGLAWLILSGNGVWGLIEGIIILTKGDAGLAQQGFTTAPVAPPAFPQQPVQPQAYPQQPVGQPMSQGPVPQGQPTSTPQAAAPQASHNGSFPQEYP